MLYQVIKELFTRDHKTSRSMGIFVAKNTLFAFLYNDNK